MIEKDLVLVGGGHSHVILLRRLGMKPVPGVVVTLISPDSRTPYSGMLPGVVAGHYSENDIHIDLGPLCRFAGARVIRDAVDDIDLAARLVSLKRKDRPAVPYDVLSLDVGITPGMDDVPGAAGAGIAVKPVHRFLTRFDAFLSRVQDGEVSSVAIVGAGAGGVELCLAVHHRLQREQWGRDVEFHLFSDDQTVLPDYPQRVQQRFMAHLRRRGIRVHTDFRVIDARDNELTSATGQRIRVDEIFFVTRAASQSWLAETGLDVDERGFVKVADTLQSISHPEVFAAGDIAHVVDHPRPKAGVFAVRQGPVLDRNIRRFLAGRRPRGFRPQQEFLSIITTGDKYAIASRNGLSVEGRWVWRWKDWIDRRFMNRFLRLPAMGEKGETETGETMFCGGCGAKISGDLLRAVLEELDLADVHLDDAATYEVPDGKIMLHTVDGFRAFIDDPYVFARVAVNHALGDIYAMGGTPVTALAMITLPYATPAKSKQLLKMVLTGVHAQLTQENVQLTGGHTGEGMELGIGFAVNGIVDRGQLLSKGGLQSGDALILTKPLGTGALFAADMQGKANSAWIELALESMLRSNRSAMEILKANGADAMTDVTGFGLAGHLEEMLGASGVSARIDLDHLPILPGTLDVMDRGITSTLHEGNRRSATRTTPASHRHYEVLFDPQTSGGLLAGIPQTNADEALAALRGGGCWEAEIIGEVVDDASGKIVY